MNKKTYLEKAVEWAEKKEIIFKKSISEEYENPQVFNNTITQDKIQTDLSYVQDGRVKYYSVVALKKKNLKKTVAKWKVLSFFASIESDNLHLLTFNSDKDYIEKSVNNHDINALIYAP